MRRPSPDFPLEKQRTAFWRRLAAAAETEADLHDFAKAKKWCYRERKGWAPVCLFCCFATSPRLKRFCADGAGALCKPSADNPLYEGLLYMAPQAGREMATDHVYIFPVFKAGQHVARVDDLVPGPVTDQLLGDMRALATRYLNGPGGCVGFHRFPTVEHLHLHAYCGQGAVRTRSEIRPLVYGPAVGVSDKEEMSAWTNAIGRSLLKKVTVTYGDIRLVQTDFSE